MSASATVTQSPRDPFRESEDEKAAIARHRAQPKPGPATDPTYLEIERLMGLHGRLNGNFGGWDGQMVRAGCEWLTHRLARPATLSELLTFFEQPWRDVVQTLEAYAPVLPLITYTLYLRAFSETYSSLGSSHAEGVVGTAYSIVQACQDYLAQQRQQAEKQAEYARFEVHIEQQRAASHKRAIHEQMLASVGSFMGAALFGAAVTVAVLSYLGLLP